MRKIIVFIIAGMLCIAGFAQKNDTLKIKKDNILQSMIHADSVNIEKQYAEREHWDEIKTSTIFPVFAAGEFSGVVAVKDANEIPDPNMEYKLLFELKANNPDSVASEINIGLVEVARTINLHVTYGIPFNKIIPVILIHGGALNAFCTNVYFKEKYKIDNRNLKLIGELKKTGTKFIASGQAMAFSKVIKKDLLPDIKYHLQLKLFYQATRLKAMCIMM